MANSGTMSAPSGFPVALSTAVDFALSPTGDFMVGPDGDFLIVQGVDCLIQEIVFRLQTRQGDYAFEPLCGASLDSLIGQPNSPDLEDKIDALIQYALTHDGLFQEDDVTVLVWPESLTQITIAISCSLQNFTNIPTTQSTINLQLSFDTQEGLLL